MVRVLVVDHDVDVADLRVDTLRRAGFEVDQCGGPTHALTACPVLHGMPCWQVEWADVLVYDVWAAGSASDDLTHDLHAQYPGKAIVLTSSGVPVGWEEDAPGRRVVSTSAGPKALVEAVRAAHESLETTTMESTAG